MADSMNNIIANSDKSWTTEQKNAIYDTGGTLLISAAAGSGKTAVLVERAVHHMAYSEKIIDADKILIVTFTNAAANELRARIAARLTQLIKKEPENINLKRQKMLLGRANICTMHSFCMQLLQRNFTILNLPADFTLADETAVYALKENAIQKTLEKMYESEIFRNFASLYGKTRSDDVAKNTIIEMYEYSRSLPYPNKILAKLIDEYSIKLPFEKTTWGYFLLNQAKQTVQNAINYTQEALSIANSVPELIKYVDALQLDINFYNILQGKLNANEWDSAIDFANDFKFSNFGTVRNYDSFYKEKVKELRANSKDLIIKLIKNVFVCTTQEYIDDLNTALPYVKVLCEAVNIFSEEFYNAKVDEKLLEYSDLEHLTLKLLSDENGKKTKQANEISNEFEFIMVDEYQDTNAIQEQLYICLSNDDESNLFFVGDVKQSIYKFRLANPENFIKKRNSFNDYNINKKHPATIILGHNFRSSKNIINQINDVFTLLMSPEVGDINYNEQEQLKAGINDDFNGGALEFNIIDINEEDVQKDDVDFVADKINNMIKSGYQIKDGENTRPCTAQDFCILLRTRTKFPLYAAALAQRGVNVFTDTGENYLTSAEVSSFISLLRVIDNPGQDIHLTAVLLSPFFNFTPDDLLLIRSKHLKGTLYAALLKSNNKKALIFCEILQWLRKIAVSVPVHELCDEILKITNYYAIIGAMENGNNKRENLQLFLSFTATIKSANNTGISALLNRVDNALKSNSSNSNAVVRAKGCVCIMTIHRSKGLEFPIVILADTATKFNLQNAYNTILFHPNFGVGLKLKLENGTFLYQSAMHAAISQSIIKELKSEQIRLLYVALTRAKQKLIISAPIKNVNKYFSDLALVLNANSNNLQPISSGLNFAHWLCIAALLHKDGDNLRKQIGAQNILSNVGIGNFEINIIEAKNSAKLNEKTVFIRNSLADEKLVSEIKSNFSIAKKIKEENYLLPLKLSVSQISHSNTDYIFSRPAFTYKENLNATQKGNVMHEFLQYANFKNAADNLQAEINRLITQKFINEDLAKMLPQNKIEIFLNSKTAQRIINADELYKEYDFITQINANEIFDDLPNVNKQINVQGIVDVICIKDNKAEIIDYKTDKNKSEEDFIKTYKKQLLLYKNAVEKRFNLTVSKCTIYSIENNVEIDVKI